MSLDINQSEAFRSLGSTVSLHAQSHCPMGNRIYEVINLQKKKNGFEIEDLFKLMSDVRREVRGRKSGYIDIDKMKDINTTSMNVYHVGDFADTKRYYVWQVCLKSKCYDFIIALRVDGRLFVELIQIFAIKELYENRTAWRCGWNWDFKIESIGDKNEECFQKMLKAFNESKNKSN